MEKISLLLECLNYFGFKYRSEWEPCHHCGVSFFMTLISLCHFLDMRGHGLAMLEGFNVLLNLHSNSHQWSSALVPDKIGSLIKADILMSAPLRGASWGGLGIWHGCLLGEEFWACPTERTSQGRLHLSAGLAVHQWSPGGAEGVGWR